MIAMTKCEANPAAIDCLFELNIHPKNFQQVEESEAKDNQGFFDIKDRFGDFETE